MQPRGEDSITRRRFIERAGVAGAGLLLTGCATPRQSAAPAGLESTVEAAEAPPAGTPPRTATALVYHPAFLDHQTGLGHPERPERLTAILKRLEADGFAARVDRVKPAEADLDTIALVHDRRYVERAREDIEAIDAGVGRLSTGDTAVSGETWRAALLAAGAAVKAVDMVCTGKAANVFCAVRPPGHHARPEKGGMGFCVFNNIAIAARYAQRRHGIERAVVIDWDVHHGNGTQDTFWTDGTVLCFHTQQAGIYPGTGWSNERGEGKAEGLMMNYPLARGTGIDEFDRLYTRELAPAARKFRPGIILVSAGYDSHRDDPLGGLALTAEGFARMTQILLDIAAELCGGRLVVCLEGGYNLQALGASASATIRKMLG